MRDIHPSSDRYPGTPANRSIRNVAVSGTHRPHQGHAEPPRRRTRRGSRFWLWALLVVVACLVCGALVSVAFAGATVTVHPRQVTVEAPAMLEARLLAPVGTLEYKTISATREVSMTVNSNGTQQVSRQASGTILISNTFSTEQQRLIANTRFEAAGGKIYRIRESVVVPGMSGGKAGTATARVYADSPGASYNTTGNTTFTIPGFKGDPRYDKMSAVSQGAITGGFVGAEPAVASADLTKAEEGMRKELTDQALVGLNTAIPQGYGMLPGTVQFTYGDIMQEPQDGKVKLTQEVAATGVVVNAGDLANTIAKQKVAGYKGEAVSLISDKLTVTASTTAEGVVSIQMEGTATLIWQFDPAKLKTALMGKGKGEFQSILAGFAPAVACTTERPCDVRIRPFWTNSFPTEPDKITVVTAKPQ